MVWPSATAAQSKPIETSQTEADDNDVMWPSSTKPKRGAASGGEAAELEALRAQLKKAKDEHQADKDFYEEALEARMNQMEELETKNEKLEDELAELKDEMQRLKDEKGATGGAADKSTSGDDAFLKEEVH